MKSPASTPCVLAINGGSSSIRAQHPSLPQFACFAKAFHRTMPRGAKLLPIPRSYGKQAVERYGFHGLSYALLVDEFSRLDDPAATKGRVLLGSVPTLQSWVVWTRSFSPEVSEKRPTHLRTHLHRSRFSR